MKYNAVSFKGVTPQKRGKLPLRKIARAQERRHAKNMLRLLRAQEQV